VSKKEGRPAFNRSRQSMIALTWGGQAKIASFCNEGTTDQLEMPECGKGQPISIDLFFWGGSLLESNGGRVCRETTRP